MKQLKGPYKKLLIASAIIVFWAVINFVFFYHDTVEWGKGFNVAVMYILTRNIALYMAPVVMLIRIIRLIKNNNTLYIFIGTLNVTVGVLCLVLYLLNEADLPWLNKCLLNLLIGFIMMVDTFIIFRTSEK